ncbi:hypothetical protein M0805_003633 [Coniferiporia weirii]|nr:hypothetical protein M0805_003633 [Coniferiporia weirii]
MNRPESEASSWPTPPVELDQVFAFASTTGVGTQSQRGSLQQSPQTSSTGGENGSRTEAGILRRRRRSTTRPGLGWMQQVAEFRPKLVLENKGSVARDHLAVERTFLAYVRTSLGLATMGVALVQLLALAPAEITHRLQRTGKALGAVTEVLGLGVIIIAALRYFGMQKALIKGKYEPAGLMIWLIAGATGALVVVMFGVLLGIVFS